MELRSHGSAEIRRLALAQAQHIPGERIRAALICLSRRGPALEVLVLDEPTDHLDLLARAALVRVLKGGTGGGLR